MAYETSLVNPLPPAISSSRGSRSQLSPAIERLRNATTYLFDLDGVVCQGSEPIDGAAELIRFLHSAGVTVGYVTNHSGKSPGAIARKLQAMGIDVEESHIVTSAQVLAATVSSVTSVAQARVVAIGTPALIAALEERGVEVVDRHPTHVAVGYVARVDNACLAGAVHWVSLGAELWATNADLTAPGHPWPHLEGGAFAALIGHVGGVTPRWFGKPAVAPFEMALARLGATASTTVMVGDRLDTDIAGAHRAGLLGVLTLTGHTPDRTQLNGAVQPDLVVDNLQQLRAHMGG